MQTGVKLQKRRRNLSLIAAAAVILSTGTFWLADSSSFALSPAPIPTGAAAGGAIATFTSLVPSAVSIPQGQGAQIVQGVLLGKVVVAAGFAAKLRVDIAWLNPQDAGAVLNNPNAWMAFGLFFPIHTGVCTGADPVDSMSITESIALCVTLNTQAAGPLNYGGKLTINATMLSGYIMEKAVDTASPSTCGTTGVTWCAPAGMALNQNVFYIISSINTPGGVAPGQQPQLTALNFYMGARPL